MRLWRELDRIAPTTATKADVQDAMDRVPCISSSSSCVQPLLEAGASCRDGRSSWNSWAVASWASLSATSAWAPWPWGRRRAPISPWVSPSVQLIARATRSLGKFVIRGLQSASLLCYGWISGILKFDGF